MPHWRSLIPSEYLKASDLAGRDFTLTIVAIERRQLDKLAKPGADDDAKGKSGKERRGVVTFKETEKFLPLNVVNAMSLAAMWGNDYTQWGGRRVTLYPGRDRLGREEVDAIRVRGAPDLENPIEFEVPRPRRKPVRVRLVPTGKGTSTSAPESPDPDQPEPGSDDGAEIR